MADTTPLGLKGLECAKMLLTNAKVSQQNPCLHDSAKRLEGVAHAYHMPGKCDTRHARPDAAHNPSIKATVSGICTCTCACLVST